MATKRKHRRDPNRNHSPKLRMSATDPRVERAIIRCRELDDTWLRLANCKLEELPKEVFELKKLSYLDLSNNNFKHLPEEIHSLPKLHRVSLFGNPLQALPDFDGLIIDQNTFINLSTDSNKENLEVLIDLSITNSEAEKFISFCIHRHAPHHITIGPSTITIGRAPREELPLPLQKIIHSLGSFNGLEVLSLRGFRLAKIPDEIRSLKSLKRLRLDALDLPEFPAWLSELPLEYLGAIDNRLSKLPPTFSQLQNLKHIDLSWNTNLKEIPDEIFNMHSLETLRLNRCKIQRIPTKILDLKNLILLDVVRNPLEDPPEEVVSKGLDAVRNYWRQRSDSGVDHLCEAKLIVLGEPGAGKTSLAKKIENKNYVLHDRQKSTEGIDVIRHQFPTTIRMLQTGKERILQRTFQVNIWDFGGQEIYHATHQFFLTRRSVYVLVCDDRKEDTDFSYWLNIVEMLSDGSPLLIVQNEKQDRTRDINLSNLRGRFPNLKGALATNLDTNRGLDQIIQKIEKELECLQHIGAGLPATWKRVREVLEREKRDFITFPEYLDICQKHGFTKLEDKLQLSEYLHDLGICLHFQDDPVLKNIVILKPSWATDAVYRVLDNPIVIEARGRFNSSSLKEIWAEAKYNGMQHELLQLMSKFQLCYSLTDNNTYIAPQLLSSEQPTYSWNDSNGLIVRYKYTFLPKGIMTRFIVSMHHLISKELVWKSGVVLERDDSQIEIIEDYSQRSIRVRATGPNQHGLLTIVDDQLEKIHRSFHKLQCEKYLPCPCKECKVKAEPYGFPFERLKKMSDKGSNIQCHESAEMIDAGRLISELFPGIKRISQHVNSDLIIIDETPVEKEDSEVFVSYAWTDESSNIVDKLQKRLQQNGIKLIRDRDELNYKDSIRDFMKRLGKGKCVVVVISEKYLKSENCMFELLQISKDKNIRERIFPIILNDANIYRPIGRVVYAKYWEDEAEELDKALKSLRGSDLTNLQQDLNLYAEIRRSFDSIADVLRDMNALNAVTHESSEFEQLIVHVKSKLLN
jgi:GTPase SAR1 family protein